jgi:hypothetical protein
MLAATRRPGGAHTAAASSAVSALAGFYGIQEQRLATALGFNLPSPGELPRTQLVVVESR